ncbi:MAG: DUF4357 domain-containing protein [Candidatus Onthovivens sp.]|nr:DUF4357 domain-containing protein [Candidatus Onthovivens sp.]
MKLVLKSRKDTYEAVAEYNVQEKKFVVKKGSKVSETIAHSTTFKAAKTIEDSRKGIVDKNYLTTKDVEFKSASTAANFVTGRSTNGLIAWKDTNGKKLKELI